MCLLESHPVRSLESWAPVGRKRLALKRQLGKKNSSVVLGQPLATTTQRQGSWVTSQGPESHHSCPAVNPSKHLGTGSSRLLCFLTLKWSYSSPSWRGEEGSSEGGDCVGKREREEWKTTSLRNSGWKEEGLWEIRCCLDEGGCRQPYFLALGREEKKKRMPNIQTQPDWFLRAVPGDFLE